MPCCDSPRISQDDDFQEHFLPGCHFSTAVGRQTAKFQHTGGTQQCLPNLIIASHNLITTFLLFRHNTINTKVNLFYIQTGPLENISLQVCEQSFMSLDQSGLNTIHSSHVLSKLLKQITRNTSFILYLTHHRKLPPRELTPSYYQV